MKQHEDNQTSLDAPASGETPAAPSGQSAVSKTSGQKPEVSSVAPAPEVAADQKAAAASVHSADSETSGKQPAGKAEAQSPSPNVAPKPHQGGQATVPTAPAVSPPVKQDGDSLKQAAQLAHKPSTDGVANPTGSNDCALAGGPSPQSPELISKSKSAKKGKPKRRDNHVSIRLTDEEWDVLEKLMSLTGMTLSEALRAIILAFASKGGSVYLRPKSPPSHLEDFLGELSKWRKEFSKAKPRLNIPTPASDKERYSEVTKWREESDRLLKAIPQLEELLRLALVAMTSLTPDRVALFKLGIFDLTRWRDNAAAKGADDLVEFYTALLELFDDAGIKSKSLE